MILISTGWAQSGFWREIFPKNYLTHKLPNTITFTTTDNKERWQTRYIYLIKKYTQRFRGKQLILKNPPNTGRLAALLELFPNSKFIFIHRNPYRVYYSTRNLWENNLKKYYSLHKMTQEEQDHFIFSNYQELMSNLVKDLPLIPHENLISIRYEDLENDPLSTIKQIYQYLKLPDFDQAESYLKKRVKLESNYKKYQYSYDEKTFEKIYKHWSDFIDLWKYKAL